MSLNIAARALTTNQSVLQVIGHNISNANTVGYSRQSVSLDAVAGQKIGNGYFGKGVELTSVKRSYDAFLTKQANSTATVAAGDEVRYQKMQQIEALFPLGEGSLGTQLNNALNAWVDVQASPADSTARQVVINRADEFAARIRDTAARLSEIGETAKLQSAEVVKAINQMAAQFADLNKKVVSGVAAGQPPNDLLDQRDQLLAELNKKINVSTVAADDGSVTLFVANSYPLVIGSKAGSLAVEADPLDSQNRQVLSFVNGSTSSTIDADMVTGGEIKGLQAFINNDLTSAMAQLGRLAFVFANEVNTQQRSGLNISGVAGTDMFTFAASVVSPAATNVGTAALSLSLTDDKLLVGSDYEVTYNTDTSVTIRRMSDNATVAGSPISLAATPSSTSVTFDGLTLTLPDQGLLNAPDAGHRFLLRPTADAAKDIAVRLFSPSELAVASRVSVTPVTSNIGNASIEYSGLTLVSGALPVTPVPPFQLTYASLGNSFAVTPAASVSPASISYTPGQPLQFTYTSGADSYTYSLTLRGQPANGDKFDLAQTSGTAVKFNSGNAQAILDLRDKTVFDGNTTLSDGYVAVFSSVASTLRESKFSAEFSAAQAASAETQRANKAGVNLDEEAALLIQYQQAYQASAKYMGTVQSLFDTLMSAFR
jgi:flagellar hook-associated protein 1 FlgK